MIMFSALSEFFCGIGMINAGMTMNAVAMNTWCSARAIRHLRQRFQATGLTDDQFFLRLPEKSSE